jgi:flavin reductase (DIM6/NTAB) family NADH-FMN oxidoreductase RutF
LLDGVAAYLDCSFHSGHVAGDHDIFIGEVIALKVDPDVQPLVFHAGQYRIVT